MGKIVATVTFESEYGHPGNRPSLDFSRKELTEAIEQAIKAAEDRRHKKAFATDAGLASWSFTGIQVK